MSQADFEYVRIARTLPKSWELERTFNDVLYDWMESAPWLAISAAAHGFIALILFMLPRDQPTPPTASALMAAIEQPPDSAFRDPPPPEVPEELEREVSMEEPVLKDAATADHNESDDGQPTEDSMGALDQYSDSAFEGRGENELIAIEGSTFGGAGTLTGGNSAGGIGGSAGGKYGGRRGGHRSQKAAAGGAGTEVALTDGLEWLKWHQSPDGSWDCDGFMANCGHVQSGASCDGPGESAHDVGVTGLAVLAFLGDGSTTREGPYREQVARAIKWLKDQQDPDTGVYGGRAGNNFMYNHAIATLAMCEAYYFSRSPRLKHSAQDAIDFIARSRNPYGAWRYDSPPNGENDMSITGWCLFAMTSARDGGLDVDPESFIGAGRWIDDTTDPRTGRTGYDKMGTVSSRQPGLNDEYDAEYGEAMTAVAILCRVFMGQDVTKSPIVEKGADLLRAKLPEWDPTGIKNDIYYWYYGSYALFQLGGPRWDAWNRSAKRALLESQCHDGDRKGSWDPKDAWGYAGGRVYETSLAVLCLEVYFRYARVLGGR